MKPPWIMAGFLRFNPRTRESATPCNDAGFFLADVSIHALVRVRLFQDHPSARYARFNPRTRESATDRKRKEVGEKVVSIHALVRVRPNREGFTYSFIMFQSTHS